MKYDFTTVMDRTGHDILAADRIPFDGVSVEKGVSAIPMWIADMSFPTAPAVLEAIEERLRFPNFGYFAQPQEYYQAIIDWHRARKHIDDLTPEMIGYENGVLGGVSAAIRAFTSPGDGILLHAPTYVGFTHVLDDLGRRAVHSRLVRDGKEIWRMDYEDMDRKLKENRIHLAIFCSPHNPTGRVWEREEIEQAMAVYAANDCIVISDEIWSDILMPGACHIPTQSVSQDAKGRTIAFYAPSKTFSLAGLIGSYHVVYDSLLRDRLRREGGLTNYNSQNILSMGALIGAYRNGGEWVDELCLVLEKNLRCACDFIRANFPGVHVMKPQGTYMLFLDCAEWCRQHAVPIRELQHRGVRAGVIWQDGEAFQWPESIRMNLALPFSLLEEAMNRLKKDVFV
ncbi:MAG: aminotransferase class I/II-fold pyridoxal phosphate-dependent enzyme [Oscillospiraceae bacterium]|nr:aminotransferase class I/II-fold pyridoxal phosphate-dependent enzyme [Oscillospiraceae bacterium]